MLKQLSVILSESIVERMLLVKFNEWGAMLIHQEIHECVSILEAAASAVDESVRDYMEGRSVGSDNHISRPAQRYPQVQDTERCLYPRTQCVRSCDNE